MLHLKVTYYKTKLKPLKGNFYIILTHNISFTYQPAIYLLLPATLHQFPHLLDLGLGLMGHLPLFKTRFTPVQ